MARGYTARYPSGRSSSSVIWHAVIAQIMQTVVDWPRKSLATSRNLSAIIVSNQVSSPRASNA